MILVTGATGNIGCALVDTLRAAGMPVRALVRDPERLTGCTDIEVQQGDLSKPASLHRAFDNVTGLFLLLAGITNPDEILVRANASGVRRVVLVSSLLAQTHPDSAIGGMALRAERVVRDSGLAWTIVRPWEFASNTLAWAPMIRSDGVVRVPAVGVASPAIDPADIAEIAAEALTGDDHSGQIYPLTGPEFLTAMEKTLAIGRALDREVRCEEQHDQQTLEWIADQAPDRIAASMRIPGVCMLEPPATRHTIEELTGSPARNFQQWACENAAAFL